MSILHPSPRQERFGIENPTRALAAGVFLSTIALESVAALRQHTNVSDQPELITRESDGEQSIYVLPGCRSDGRFVADQLGPQLGELGSVYVSAYPKRGFSFEGIRDQLIEARGRDERPASFYVMSMGGMVLSHLLRDETFKRQFGAIEKVVFDSSPSDVSDLSSHTMKAVTAAKLVPGIPTTSRLYGQAMRRSAEKSIRGEIQGDDLLAEHLRTTARTPLSAVEGQTKFMRQTHFAHRELSRAAVGEFVYLSSVEDEVVNLDKARANYQMVYDRELKHVIDPMRPNPSHAAGIEYSQAVIEQLRANDRYADVIAFPPTLRTAA